MGEVWAILTLSFREWPAIWRVPGLWKVQLLLGLYYLLRLPAFDIWLQRRLTPTAEEDLRFGDTPYQTALTILRLAQVGPQDTLYDLGSGRGKMVFVSALACGCQAVGVELLPSYNLLAQRITRQLGLEDRLHWVTDDFLECDLQGATVLYTACTTWAPLTRDLLLDRVEELAEGTRWISVGHEQRHPHLNLFRAERLLFSWGYEEVWFYKVQHPSN